jgi:hypothetical protein
MSNTSTVTPYESDSVTDTSTSSAIDDLFSWLGDTDEDRATDQSAKETRNRQLYIDMSRSRTIAAPPVVSIELHMKTAETLMRSVSNAGYKVVREVPRVNADFLIIQSPKGERVAVEQMHKGGVRVHAAHSRTRIDQIVRRHTLDRAVAHLTSGGMQVIQKELPNGEIQLVGRGLTPQGKQELHAQIHKDGSSVLDVVDVKGPRCEEIARRFAEATDGQITATNKKDSYYCLPGELRRERVHGK